MPIPTRLRLFAAAAEGTLGLSATLDAAAGAMNIEEMSRNPAVPFTMLTAQNGYGRRGGVGGARSGTKTIMHYLVGKGTTGLPYWASTLLPACGGVFAAQVFTPVANCGTGITCGLFKGAGATARLYKLAGCMGNAVFTFKAGEIVPVRFTFTGKQYAAVTQTLPTVTHPTATPPRFAGGTFTIGGTTYQIDQLEFDMGNTVVLRPDPTDATGYISAWIPDRLAKVRISPEALPLATKDWDDFYYSGTTAALALTVGGSANNTIALAAPALQLISPPGEGDRDGIETSVLEFQCNQNSDTEDSEYVLTFS